MVNDANDKEVIGLRHIIIYYLRYWKLFAAAFAVSLVGALLYLLLVPKTYEIAASIQVQDERDLISSGSGFGLGEAAGLMKSFGLGGSNVGGINMDDELMVLNSNDLVRKMVLDLGINVEYSKPFSLGYKLYGESPLRVTADTLTMNRLDCVVTLDVSVGKDGKVEVDAEAAKKDYSFSYTSLPAVVELPQGHFTVDYDTAGVASIGKAFSLIVKVNPPRWVAEDLLDMFVIEESSKTSNVIELSCRDYEKRRGLDMLNTLIHEYNIRARGIKLEETDKALTFLDGRIDEVTRNLQAIEIKIEEYKLKNRLTDIEYDVQFYVDQMKEIQVKLIDLQTQARVIEMMDAYVKAPENRYNLVPMLLSAQEGEKGSAITKYNEALVERARLLKTSSPDNPLIETWNNQVDQLRESVILTIGNARKSLDMTVEDLKNKEKALYEKMGGIPTQERQYVDYNRQREILQGVYLVLLQKREEIALATGQNKQRARVVDVAYVKKLPVAPRKLFAAIGMFLFTLVVPIGCLFAREQWRALVKTYKESKEK